jgi:hypothetical protein
MNAPNTSDQIVRQQRFTLLELLDRLLDKGVMVKGEVLLSVADIDLVYLNLGLLLSSVKTIEKATDSGHNSTHRGRGNNSSAEDVIAWQTSAPKACVERPQVYETQIGETQVYETKIGETKVCGTQVYKSQLSETKVYKMQIGETKVYETRLYEQKMGGAKPYESQIYEHKAQIDKENGLTTSFGKEYGQDRDDDKETIKPLSAAIDYGLDQLFQPKANIDPENVGKGLAKLVLTVVELLRKLMEKQAVRRMDDSQLHAEEIERMGTAFFLLDEKMEQLKKTFDLKDEDLNLDLGPLGELL